MEYTYEFFRAMADYVRGRIGGVPEVGIVLGSGLGPFARSIEEPVAIDYRDIPGFLTSTAPGHAGKLIYGTVSGRRVICMAGRFHSYEGYDFEQLVIPVRLFKLLGVQSVILTNAAGAVNRSFAPGDVMIMTDHIKLTGDSPLRGKNIEEFGPRFFDASHIYTPAFRPLARRCIEESGLTAREGVYMFFTGPQFETPAEIRAARVLGADAVGMSTVTEALTAAHCGLPVLGLSVMTNMAAGVLEQPLSAEEVNETASRIEERFSRCMASIVEQIGEVGE